jgi:hypothetical protein
MDPEIEMREDDDGIQIRSPGKKFVDNIRSRFQRHHK